MGVRRDKKLNMLGPLSGMGWPPGEIHRAVLIVEPTTGRVSTGFFGGGTESPNASPNHFLPAGSEKRSMIFCVLS